MTSENTLTGRNGRLVVDDALVARTTNFNISRNLATTNQWGDSDSEGYTNRSAGRRDCTFSTEGKYDTENEVWDLFEPEDIAEAVLWITNTGSLYWAFPRALNTEFSMVVNIDTEEVIGWTANWGADGIFYRPGQTGAPSHTLPA